MIEVEFIYNQTSTIIQCSTSDIIKDIYLKFTNKAQLDINSIYFLYSGQNINENLSIQQITKEGDLNMKKMKILVFSKAKLHEDNKSLIKSNNIICPVCKNKCLFKIENFKFKLFNCKNNHTTENMTIDEFLESQQIDESKIICEICNKNNKYESFEKKFYKCCTCNKNLCTLCKSKHAKEHLIMNYDDNNYICNKHNEPYSTYCKTCKINMCLSCKDEHDGHENIYFQNIMPKINEVKKEKDDIKNSVDKFINEIKLMIKKLSIVMENIRKYYDIYNDIIKNYETKNRNYEIILNIEEILKNNIKHYIQSYKNNDILNIYNQMFQNEINLIYQIKKENEEEENEEEIDEGKIRIFGKEFVNNNKNNCKIIYNNQEYELTETFNIQDKLEIKLRGINNVTNMSCLFAKCKNLISLPDISKWNTENVINMSYLFYKCKSLKNLDDISKWNISNVKYIHGMFSGCSSLSSIPDISKWNTENIILMGGIFSHFSSLTPKDNSKFTDIKIGLFDLCSSLKSLPDISKWNTNNVTIMYRMFSGCSSLNSLPDISNWNTHNVQDMSYMFDGCSSLNSLPDISKWNTNNVTDMSGMFCKCSSLNSLPDISKWNTNNVTNMSYK